MPKGMAQGKRTTISISQRTKEALGQIKHPGQSYDGLIEELIRFWEKEHPATEKRKAASITA